MSALISVWLKDLLPRTPGVVRAVAKREFINAAREFFRDSGAWKEVVESVYLSDGNFSYEAVPQDSGSEVLEICSVEVNGLPIDGVAERPPGTRQSGTPTRWYPTGPTTFEVWPTPDQYDDEIRVRVFLIPTETATSLPDVAYRAHYDALLDGALGRLFSHPAKPYSNPVMAQYHLNRFRNAIGVAAAKSKQGVPGGQNWQYPRYGK